ncbi:hypothetical protein ACQKLP_10920 [Chitinophaga sp. NPDC101104]|uniref:hypothetical protein n=1 Tax=Chitinophaga sp. NPDC101104 TaxID=3390561 RepID=UPI003CFED7EE
MSTQIPSQLNDDKLLQDFVSLLLRKGYDGQFFLQSLSPPAFFTGVVELCLQKFIDSFQRNYPQSAEITLTTDFQLNDRDSPIYAVLKTRFSADDGWQITSIQLKAGDQQRASPLPITSNKDIPAYKSLPTLCEPPRQSWLRRILVRIGPKSQNHVHP